MVIQTVGRRGSSARVDRPREKPREGSAYMALPEFSQSLPPLPEYHAAHCVPSGHRALTSITIYTTSSIGELPYYHIW